MTGSESWWVKLRSAELEGGILNEKLASNLAALVEKLKATSGARKRRYE